MSTTTYVTITNLDHVTVIGGDLEADRAYRTYGVMKTQPNKYGEFTVTADLGDGVGIVADGRAVELDERTNPVFDSAQPF